MNTIEYNVLLDWKKVDVNPIERSKFLIELIKKEGKSQRQFAKDNNISYSTLHDWISMRQIDKQIHVKINRNEILSVADRLLFLLSKKERLTTKEFEKIDEIKRELGKKSIFG